VAEHICRERFVDDYEFCFQICGNSEQSRSILGRLYFDVRIGEKCRNGAEHHGSDKNSHRRNTLRHDDDHSIAATDTMFAEQPRLASGSSAKVGKAYRLVRVFINPLCNKWAVWGRCIERLNEIVEFQHACGV
jgi:hypothetical protein